MRNKRMEYLRDILNAMIISGQTGVEELLAKSRELDKLILQSLKAGQYSKIVLVDELMKESEMMIDKLQLFEKMYQAMRIVDPVSKKVLDIKESKLHEMKIPCYQYWKKNEVCENCISMRAFNEDDTVFKVENNGKDIFMVTAVPIFIQERKLVVELLKNVTNTMYLGTGKYGDEVKSFSMIEYMNQVAVKDELTGLYNRV